MQASVLLLLSMMVLLPALGAAGLGRVVSPERARRVAVTVASLTLVLALGVLVLVQNSAGARMMASEGQVLGLSLRLEVNGMSVVALLLTALLTLGQVGAGPRQMLDLATLRALLLTESAALAFFCVQDVGLMLVFWVAMLLPAEVLISRRAKAQREARALRTFRIYLLAGSLPLLAAVVLLGLPGWQSGAEAPLGLSELLARGIPAPRQTAILALMVLAVAFRMAVVPFHSWLPVLLARGPFGVGLLMVNAHTGLYLLVRVVMPLLPEAWTAFSPLLEGVGLFCAFYGAVLALSQVDLRRTVGFLLVSQSGLMLAGLAERNTESLAGALLQSVAAAVPLTGLMLVVRAIEVRTGTTDMTRLGGLVRRGPRMAALFFLLGIASLGFPGTLSFVGEDLLLHGILGTHPLVALPLLLTTAINGITFLRAFQRTFLGAPAHGHASVLDTVEDLLPRERIAALALCVLAFLGGLFPGPLMRLREHEVSALAGPAAAEHAEAGAHGPAIASH
ncbi:NADH:ubiquinone oxidoreductase subunit 4 (subunit M) [Archangium gephyra]|uniref:NADH-ubiquinone oxidoreductase chain M n=1 Tax=Archangium gephyra TaxID=48 RepID=A0AAC8Q381_9BACT|nr:proton-conducting transporter membrane subunit [Archangium gephyra]AKJ00289.1 NADH-ubiquinone oxidoreductase chain M [Archangium gephyra]REG33014.1 NADH:ubiquinone oxidoreductase subunit 4 (subunit M) [Archangium gephyra]